MMTNPYKARGFDHIWRATGYSIDGLVTAYRSESAFRHELWLALALLPFSFLLGSTWVEVALLAASLLLVLIVELLNSAIEAAIDRVSLDPHDLSKRAKDIGSAAVFLALLLCAIVWGTALWHRLAGG